MKLLVIIGVVLAAVGFGVWQFMTMEVAASRYAWITRDARDPEFMKSPQGAEQGDNYRAYQERQNRGVRCHGP